MCRLSTRQLAVPGAAEVLVAVTAADHEDSPLARLLAARTEPREAGAAASPGPGPDVGVFFLLALELDTSGNVESSAPGVGAPLHHVTRGRGGQLPRGGQVSGGHVSLPSLVPVTW